MPEDVQPRLPVDHLQAHLDFQADLKAKGITGVATIPMHRALAKSLRTMDDFDAAMRHVQEAMDR